jgi:hypothetical protein
MSRTSRRRSPWLLLPRARVLALAVAVGAALVVGLALPAHAAAANVVPNGGFEQGGCGASTPVICGWESSAGYMSRDGSPGGYSMSLSCGALGCYGSGLSLSAQTDPAFCATVGPGPHSASFFGTGGDPVSFSADFYQGSDCTGPLGSDSLEADALNAGYVTGVLVAPPGTHSALFSVAAHADCPEDFCPFYATFDDLDVEDSVLPVPAISSFTPAGGVVGARVDIQGWNFTGATSVAFNGTPADFSVDSNSEIHATVPDGATSGPISVTTPEGIAASKSSFTISSSPAPAISSFTPMAGQIGTSVEVRGWNFTGATSVAFNGTEAQFTLGSDSEIHASVPSGATAGSISVTTPNGTATSCCFWVPPPPSISSFTPTNGPAGTSVSVQGEDFTGATSVTFNGALATFTVESSTNITAIVPNGATNGPISVTTPEGTATSSASYTVDIPPVARFTASCAGVSCSFDAGASSDPDGTVQSYRWDFGDGAGGSGRSATHSYGQAAGYTVTLTVTDDGGVTGTVSRTVTLISLSAHGYKVRGLEKVDLSWSGPSGASFDVYRDGGRIATVQAGAYTDNINKKGSATYAYKVCVASVCSNTASVSF